MKANQEIQVTEHLTFETGFRGEDIEMVLGNVSDGTEFDWSRVRDEYRWLTIEEARKLGEWLLEMTKAA